MRQVKNITAIADPEPNRQTRRVLTETAAESTNYTPKSDPPPGGPILRFFAILCPAPLLPQNPACETVQNPSHRFRTAYRSQIHILTGSAIL